MEGVILSSIYCSCGCSCSLTSPGQCWNLHEESRGGIFGVTVPPEVVLRVVQGEGTHLFVAVGGGKGTVSPSAVNTLMDVKLTVWK